MRPLLAGMFFIAAVGCGSSSDHVDAVAGPLDAPVDALRENGRRR
jgi:hypothetical protein